MCSSGVQNASGSAFSAALGSFTRLNISSRRAPLYSPSSKPYQLSLKNMCPLISPASNAPVSFILALTSECPVFHNVGFPPGERIHPHKLRGGLGGLGKFPSTSQYISSTSQPSWRYSLAT